MRYTLLSAPKDIKTALSAVVIAAFSLGIPSSGAAQTATLVMTDLCDDPSAAFDYEWSKDKHSSEALFFMDILGKIFAVTDNAASFDSYKSIYVAAHGGGDSLSGMKYDEFMDNFKLEHPSTPTEIFFAVCKSAAEPDSLLKQINSKYGNNINKLSGGVTGCALTYHGDPTLKNAEYKINTKPVSEPVFNSINQNLTARWNNNYPSSHQNYQQSCNKRTFPFVKDDVDGFVETVLLNFSFSTTGEGAQSNSYLDLIKNSEGGDPLSVCGKNPYGTGVVACP
ncbi:MAG: hypothetical protein JKY27_13380 [Magnetovibrio sp.]|nr:hypothetical protein [Magnetovibrio sp.]